MNSISRRAFLKTIGQAGLICAAPSAARAVEALNRNAICISILHTTDLHGHILPTLNYDGTPDLGGLARCATQIARWRNENPNSVVIDVGDVYQGTDVALRSKGKLMIDLLNLLEYDAWIVGNHEFDWGIEPFLGALKRSRMPVLAANTVLEGRTAGGIFDTRNPFARIQPYILKEIAGIKIAIVGVTTPGMPFWFRPEFTRGIEFQHAVEPVRRAIASAKYHGADAFVLAGHMGLKPRAGGDDFANNVTALTFEFPEAAVFVAGHTHQLIQNRQTNNVLLTQADHFGIHIGRVDLFFDRDSKRLIRSEARCLPMNREVQFDQVVLSRAKSHLDKSEIALRQPVGEVAETLRTQSRPGEPSDVEQLIGAAIMEGLSERGTAVDGAMHGIFDERDVKAGPKTVRDIWSVIPFENHLVTADLTADEIKSVMEEVYSSREDRNILGMKLLTEKQGTDVKIASIVLRDGRPLERGKKYKIAFNSFDSRSAGHRFMKLRSLLESPTTNCLIHPVQTRDVLIGYFRRHKVIYRIRDPKGLPAAA